MRTLLSCILFWCGCLLLPLWSAEPWKPTSFRGSSALEYTRRAVAFGPRPAGSAANRQLQRLIAAACRKAGATVTEDAFTATTPLGPIPMRNILAHFPGRSGQAIVLTGHFDSKQFEQFRFVGANDGGASAGLLLEMARVLGGTAHADDIWLVWFDGEEAFKEWSATDGIYGSRHLAAKWQADGTLKKVKALINVDMIGDTELGIVDEQNSSAPLRALIGQSATALGYGRYFMDGGGAIEDDHMPFVQRGVNAADLIDFNYGPGNSYWHTAQDTMDKLSAQSLQIVGSVLIETMKRLEKP